MALPGLLGQAPEKAAVMAYEIADAMLLRHRVVEALEALLAHDEKAGPAAVSLATAERALLDYANQKTGRDKYVHVRELVAAVLAHAQKYQSVRAQALADFDASVAKP